MSQFSSNEAVSLEKLINRNKEPSRTNPSELDFAYETDRCADWIKDNGYKRVCLQFPDFLLPDSASVAVRLQNKLDQTVYIMGDTSYESCCIDYVAAAHVNADAIVHFGPKCFSASTNEIPCLKIYEKAKINVDSLKEAFKGVFTASEDVVVVLDTPYILHEDIVKMVFREDKNVDIHCIDEENLHITTKALYIGENNRKLLNFMFIYTPKDLYYYDPKAEAPGISNYNEDTRIIKRRRFLSEKIKDSRTIGIVIGTLAVRNYLKVIERIKRLLKLNHKKYYVISVGKPTVAKLANFPEIDLYVIVSCAMNEIYDSREFYQPLVTPYDLEMALNPHMTNSNFSYDFNTYLPGVVEAEHAKVLEGDVSLLTGNIRGCRTQTEEDDLSLVQNQIAVKAEGAVALNSSYGAGFLAEKTWKGLEQNLGQNEACLASEGRKGIAQGYENEN